ncbi:hypothetical protein Hrd1104_12330 [Halorhabdus sp. CBA1104]|uniref:hypothetical protein n=1 Tax=Halorhabdus sp. CBA1104 TaxID=1380432 RepID=UPI0012B2E5C9|nr:hypothetical protein [Halorhabdus sp. CBA1104]QGN08004.1 hypothetical protein Hrd1104_12330 [Halorhabdus sp. CBA1104]
MTDENNPRKTQNSEQDSQPRGNTGGQPANQGGAPGGQQAGGTGAQGQGSQHTQGQQGQGGQYAQDQQGQGGQYAQQGQYAQGGGYGGSSLLNDLQRPEPKRYLKGIVGTMGIASVLLGAMTFLLGMIGGFSFVPGAVEVAGSTASAMGTSSGPQVGQALGTTHQLTIGYLTAEIAPFIAFGLAPLIGLFVATRMSDDVQTRRMTAGAGVFLGGFVFVLVTTLMASFIVPSLSAFTEAAGSSAAGLGGLPAGASEMSGSLNNLSSIQFGNLIINSVIVGLMSGIAAFGAAYAADTFLGEGAGY